MRRTDRIYSCDRRPVNVDSRQYLHAVKFGVNYRFGGPLVARYWHRLLASTDEPRIPGARLLASAQRARPYGNCVFGMRRIPA